MGRDFMLLAAFLIEPHPATPPLDEVVFHLHCRRRAYTREGVGHERDQRPVAETHHRACINAVEQNSGFVRREHRRFAFLDDMFGARHRMRRVHVHDMTDYQPVEQHAQRSFALCIPKTPSSGFPVASLARVFCMLLISRAFAAHGICGTHSPILALYPKF
jgi:hypothetical protein